MYWTLDTMDNLRLVNGGIHKFAAEMFVFRLPCAVSVVRGGDCEVAGGEPGPDPDN